ncbi:MAG: UDP-N-acetylmuramoyl-L-alanine--D-glutamate ligase [Candidatus Gottesmanbacteria bacterium]|nr:UDP-N-acetylmuramoyl-L-alanine--D-glutamate ligase [Candidatus Gottesmanbacteria bacterium]
MQTYKNSLVAVLGLSVEGVDSVRFFHAEGARIWCCDRRVKEELGDTYALLQPLAEGFQLGKGYLDNLSRFDLVVRTPGMSLRLPELVSLRKHRKEITSQTKLFFTLCKAAIIGVTGTKGKGTTSTLIAQMLEADGKTVWLGGNVGTPVLSKVRTIKQSDTVVLELSSFQLEDCRQSPHIAVILKTTQEHLANQDTLASNFHETRETYVKAKKSIVRYQKKTDVAIINADDPTSLSFAAETPARILYFSRSKQTLDAHVADDTVYLNIENKPQKICSLGEIKLRGIHNLDNIAAASLAARASGVSSDAIRRAAMAFEGLEHRLETVRDVHGVLYVNDSFSTVPETAIAAIESFSQPMILIAGGSEKGSDFTELGKEVASHPIKVLIAIGRMTDRIVDAVCAAGYTGRIITGARSMHEIVSFASGEAVSGDVVLLSPACASFDMFKNYKERGKLFKHEVSLL